jgi:DNA-binding response OmpR family regulator
MAAREAYAGRVLVVEDDESTALFVTRVLSRSGFDASWVCDAEQATVRMDHESFDVLLADYRLPGRSGMDLARDTRQACPAMGIAVMTSFAEGDTADEAIASGADDFLEKPLHSSNLVARMSDLVSRSRSAGRASRSPSGLGAIGSMETAPGSSPSVGDPGSPAVAESGSEEREALRDAGSPVADAEVAGDATCSRLEGADGVYRARFSALSEIEESRLTHGCEGWRDAFSRGEAGAIDRDLLARVAHPAMSYLVAQRLLLQRAVAPILMWASGAPAISIGSNAGIVAAPVTSPDWSITG